MRILLVGCGKVGSALLDSWCRTHSREIFVIQPSMGCADRAGDSVRFFPSFHQLPKDFSADFVVLCVKPQDLKKVLPYVKGHILLSFLAGVRLNSLKFKKIVRVMPNLGLKYGLSPNLALASNLDRNEVKKVESLLSGTGPVFWLKDESQLDALTPLSGSGPGYFLLLAETLIKEAMALGLDQATSKEIIGLVLSASASMASDGDKNYESLIKSVCSKGGVTEAALKGMKPGMEKVIKASLRDAKERTRELSNEASS